jgi:hypothetical protein
MNAESVLQALDAEIIARDTLDFIKVRSETCQEGEGSLFLADLLRREGFEPIIDQVGNILSYEVTRLARNCTDWYPLIAIAYLVSDKESGPQWLPPVEPIQPE